MSTCQYYLRDITKYLTNLIFSVSTVSYGSLFFAFDLWPSSEKRLVCHLKYLPQTWVVRSISHAYNGGSLTLKHSLISLFFLSQNGIDFHCDSSNVIKDWNSSFKMITSASIRLILILVSKHKNYWILACGL